MRIPAAVLLLAVLGTAHAADKKAPPPDPSKVDYQFDLRIPLRDGVKLHASRYAPKGQKEGLPCVFTLTPYIADSYHERGMYFAANGYVFLLVDARGRGLSEGDFNPDSQEASDGPDVVEWLAKQPFCNGKVAMWGGSYAGEDQWMTAKALPPHLSTIVPAAAAKAGVDFPATSNIAYPYAVQWLTLTSGKAKQEAIFGDQKFWDAKYRQMYLEHSAFAAFDRLAGNPLPRFAVWNAHPFVDAYWQACGATPEQYAGMKLPILSITASYDDDQQGALAWYREYFQHATRAARDRHYLIIGPWDHAGTRTPRAEVGGLKFADAALLDMNQLHKQWYDWTMKSGKKPEFLKDKVAYYVTAADQWRYAPSLEAVTAKREPLYLRSNGAGSNSVFASGALSAEAPKAAAADQYVYDPLDTAPGKDEAIDENRYLVDQSDAVRNLTHSLIYHSAPFEQDTEVSGFFKLSVWLALDQPDTDFRAEVWEVLADGSAVRLAADVLRARYREGLKAAKLVPKGEVLRYDFERFTFISRLVKKGSRLRLVFGPINSIYLQKNYNSGGEVARETAKDARTVTVTLYQDAAHPSALYIPMAAKD